MTGADFDPRQENWLLSGMVCFHGRKEGTSQLENRCKRIHMVSYEKMDHSETSSFGVSAIHQVTTKNVCKLHVLVPHAYKAEDHLYLVEQTSLDS